MKTINDYKEILTYQSDFFKEWFGGMEVKETGNTLYSKVLERDMNNQKIIEELKPSEVSLGDIISHLKDISEKRWMIFYCKDKGGVLRAVDVCLFADGWSVFANSVEGSDDWDVGDLVFSAIPFDTQTSPLTLERAIGICVMNGYEVKKNK